MTEGNLSKLKALKENLEEFISEVSKNDIESLIKAGDLLEDMDSIFGEKDFDELRWGVYYDKIRKGRELDDEEISKTLDDECIVCGGELEEINEYVGILKCKKCGSVVFLVLDENGDVVEAYCFEAKK